MFEIFNYVTWVWFLNSFFGIKCNYLLVNNVIENLRYLKSEKKPSTYQLCRFSHDYIFLLRLLLHNFLASLGEPFIFCILINLCNQHQRFSTFFLDEENFECTLLVGSNSLWSRYWFFILFYFLYVLKVRQSRNQIMLSWILQKNERWISALEDYYFEVNTKESLSSCKKNIDSLFVLTLR